MAYSVPDALGVSTILSMRPLSRSTCAFFEAAGYNDVPYGKAYIEAGLPVNFQHPVSGKTALHETCAHAVHPDFAYMLLEVEDCDFLLQDKRGRLAYQCAYEFGRSVDLAVEIRKKTLQQASARNVKVSFDFEVGDHWDRLSQD